MSSSLSAQCLSCGEEFEIGIGSFLERPGSLKCPACGARPTTNRSQVLANGLEDLLSGLSGLATKFKFDLQLESDQLPPPWGGTPERQLVEDRGDDEGLVVLSTMTTKKMSLRGTKRTRTSTMTTKTLMMIFSKTTRMMTTSCRLRAKMSPFAFSKTVVWLSALGSFTTSKCSKAFCDHHE